MNEPARAIPFNRADLAGNEWRYLAEAVNGGHIAGDGRFTHRCQAFLEEALAVPKTLLTTSCTHALEMAALLLDLQEGDEVIVPSYTFVSTANAFALRGARPAFVDVRPDTFNLDEKLLEDLVTERTRAVVAVHYGGVGCEMDAILEVAARRGLAVIEDNAHGLFGKYRGRHLGTFGCLAAQSFHETKSFTCGEGGALLVNDARYIQRAEILREKGTDRSRFFRGQVDKYTWVDLGSSYPPSDMLAAFLLAQLEAREAIQEARRRVWNTYHRELADWARQNGVRLPIVPEHCEQACHLFPLVLPSAEDRQRFTAHLKSRDILSVFHYQPLHLSAMGARFGAKPGDCPVAELLGERLVRLPFYNQLAAQDQERIVETIRELRF